MTVLAAALIVGVGGVRPVDAQAPTAVIPVDSPAARFSPGNWAGDVGRGGHTYRRSWVNGSYSMWSWSTTNTSPQATLEITNPTPGSAVSYFADGHFVDNIAVPSTGGIAIEGLSGAGPHELTVYLRNSAQRDRWSGANAFTISGLLVDAGATPGAAPPRRPWALIVGDSITEGIMAANGSDSNLDDYSFLVGQALRRTGWDYGLSACGYSGWLRPGDATQDVPPYYAVAHGVADAGNSRWDKVNASTSLLDARGHLSADGELGQEPSAILINYGTNEALSGSSLDDLQASITQGLAALRRAAPRAWICVFIPFGLENTAIYPNGSAYIAAIRAGVANDKAQHPADKRVSVIDLGPEIANALASTPYGGGVHPNTAGHALIASQVIPLVVTHLSAK